MTKNRAHPERWSHEEGDTIESLEARMVATADDLVRGRHFPDRRSALRALSQALAAEVAIGDIDGINFGGVINGTPGALAHLHPVDLDLIAARCAEATGVRA